MADRFDKFTERAVRVLSFAEEEAQRLEHDYIGTEHLLLGLVHFPESGAVIVLGGLGVDISKVRAAVEFLSRPSEPPPPAGVGGSAVLRRLVDRARGDRQRQGARALAPGIRKAIELAVDEARRMNAGFIGTEHLLLGLLRVTDGVAFEVLGSLGLSLNKARTGVLQVAEQARRSATVPVAARTMLADNRRMPITQPDATPIRLATGFEFTEGPLWHPDGFLYFCDTRVNRLYKLRPGGEPEVAREDTGRASGVTFDLAGNLVMVEADRRRVVRVRPDGAVEVLAELYEGKKLNRPNDIVCASDGSIYFTDPTLRQPFSIRELETAVYRIAPDGTLHLFAEAEFPNGLALSLDEQTLYVANTRTLPYIQAIAINADKTAGRRRIFADMTGDEPGVPDGMKLDAFGHVYCTGPGGIWVMNTTGELLTILRFPEQPSNMAFGGDDLRTLFVTARNSVYSLQMNVPGHPHPWYARR